MKKIIPFLVFVVLVGCNWHKPKAGKQSPQKQNNSQVDPRHSKLIKVVERWNEMKSKFDGANTLAEKDSILMEMSHEKFRLGCEQSFDSIIWSFLQDERTFYYPFKSESPDWFVATSKDGKVKMYSYDQHGGTARFGRTIIQYIDELGHIRVKELVFEEDDHGVLITPIFRTIKKTKDGYTLYGGTTVSSQEYYKCSELLADTFFIGGLKNSLKDDSFTILYRQPVNDYKVKAQIRFNPSDDVLSADLSFSRNGKSSTLHTTCFADSFFCKGRMDYQSENPVIFRKYRNKTVYADYHDYNKDARLMPIYTPFFFRDLDFDGIKELVIVHRSMAVRYHDGYDIYRIVEDKPFLIDYPPYNDNKEYWGFGMTDYPEFDYKKKTISCPYPEGELTWAGRTVYGISKKQKDTVIVNGKKHYFNHLEPISEIKY